MREWIDGKIQYLYSKIGREYTVFEPTKEFYEILEKIEIIPPLREVLENIDKNRLPYMTFDTATKIIEKHLGRKIPKIEFRQIEQAGRYQVEGDKRDIEISHDYKEKGRQLGTILAHEIAHDFLFSIGVRLQDKDENERLTDLASVMLGLGKLMLNGAEEKSLGVARQLCYLPPSDLAYAYVKVNSLHNIPVERYFTNLRHEAFLLVEPHVHHSYNEMQIKRARAKIDSIAKNSSITRNKIERIRHLHNQIEGNQALMNQNISSLKIEPEDATTLVNLHNNILRFDFEHFISHMIMELNDADKKLDIMLGSLTLDNIETASQHLRNLDDSISQREKESEHYLEQLFEILAVQEKYFPNRSSELKSRLQELAREERFGEALKLAGKEDSKLLNDLGIIAAKKKDRIALEIFEKIIRLDPNNAIAYYNRGKLYRDLDENGKAVEDYHKAIELDPNNAEAYYNCGNANLSLNQYHEAINDYRMARKLDSNNAMIHYNIGRAHSGLKQHREAIRDYGIAIKLNPNSVAAYYVGCGDAYFCLNQYGRANRYYKKALKINPNEPNVRDKINLVVSSKYEQDRLRVTGRIRIACQTFWKRQARFIRRFLTG